MPTPKMKGWNSLSKLKLANSRKTSLKQWVFYPGDMVEVIGGKDMGKRGKVLSVVRGIDRLMVDGCRLAKKHVKPNASNGKGEIVTKPMPIHFSDVKLVDPVVSKTTDVELKQALNPKTGRWELQRRLIASNTWLPIPSFMDRFKDSQTKTWQPSLSSIPFPASILNQWEKLRRINSERIL
ncbi:translation protein SH3-like domain-containing protein [Chytridium lagenaria]|nr:translation protein SH3-like domain-containing protein [Chytridium lagenaria]